ncbi:MAG: hypothetical protein WEB58_04880 [Planctomycetaceae bacterium]
MKPFYSREGDTLKVYLKDADNFAERLDDVVTVYLSESTNEIVGCKIKGVSHLCRQLGDFGVELTDGHITIGMLFIVSWARASAGVRDRFEQLAERFKSTPLDIDQLLSC